MITFTTPTSPRSALARAAFASLVLALALTFSAGSALLAADAPAKKIAAEKAAPVPLKATFEKVKDGENGPYILHLKNDSKTPIKATAKILLSVFFHADAKAKHLPEETVAAGKTWTLSGLAANDKVIITADGFSPLELTVH